VEGLALSTFATRKLSLTAAFAVIYAVLRLIPTFPMVGTQATFSLSDILAAVYGIVLGPVVGSVSIALGTFTAAALGKPLTFLGLDFIPASTSALLSGLISRGFRRYAFFIYIALFILFAAHPYTSLFVELPGQGLVFFYPWLHLAALIVLLSPLTSRATRWLSDEYYVNLPQAVAVVSFVGVMGQHLAGALVFETVLGNITGAIPPEGFAKIWEVVFWLYPIERLVLTLGSTLLGSALIMAIRSGRLLPT